MANYNFSTNSSQPNYTGTNNPIFTTPSPTAPIIQPQTPMQSFFPQAQGNVFMINSQSEINNIPISNGMSAAFFLSDGIVFLKTIQNGNPILIGYKLSPLEQFQPAAPQQNVDIAAAIDDLSKRLKNLEEGLSKKGGNQLEWQV